MLSLVVHKNTVCVWFENCAQDNLQLQHCNCRSVFFCSKLRFCFLIHLKCSTSSDIEPSPILEVSRVAAITLSQSWLSHHGWINCKMSTAIENRCFENDEKPNLRGGSHGMFDVARSMGCCVVLGVVVLSGNEGSLVHTLSTFKASGFLLHGPLLIFVRLHISQFMGSFEK